RDRAAAPSRLTPHNWARGADQTSAAPSYGVVAADERGQGARFGPTTGPTGLRAAQLWGLPQGNRSGSDLTRGGDVVHPQRLGDDLVPRRGLDAEGALRERGVHDERPVELVEHLDEFARRLVEQTHQSQHAGTGGADLG